MKFKDARIDRALFLALAAFILGYGPQAAAQGTPALVAKPYPGAVPEHTKDGKHVLCGDNRNAYCFLTRDPVEKVGAFYAQQGITLQSPAAKNLAQIGWWSNFTQALRLQEARPGALLVAPMEFYQTKGADDEPSYFNAVVVMTGAKKTPLQADSKGQQALSDDKVLGPLALTSISKIMVPLYGDIFMEPARLIPHYNRHLATLSGYFRRVDGESAAKMKYVEMHPTWTQPAGSNTDAHMDAMKIELAESKLENELDEILDRKPDRKREYRALLRGNRSKEARVKIQPDLDRVLMTDPELAAWKKRWDALAQQTKKGGAKEPAQDNRTLRDADVEAYLQALSKEVYATRILIHATEGRRVKRDAATLKREWSF